MKLGNLYKQLGESYHQDRDALIVMAPSWILSVLFISIVAMYFFGIAPRGITLASFILVVFLGFLAIAISLYSMYLCSFMYEVGIENTERMEKLYLNGYPAWRYFDSKVFPRMRCYVGHELCYEAAALEMMAWRGHEATYYVFADVWNYKRKCRCEHSWVEVKCYGVWWVIDPIWGNPTIPTPRSVYNLIHFTRYVRAFNAYGFWSSSLANTFYERLNRRSTSYLFGELGFFRRDTNSNRMYADLSYMNTLKESTPSGGGDGYYIFGEKRPISQEIITQFLTKPEIVMPSFRAQKHALAMVGRM